MNIVKLLHDLHRRRVFRGAGFYLIGAWLVLQVADVISEPAGLPSWTITVLLYAAVIGFPLAVYLGWRYQLGEHGLVRTPSLSAVESDDIDLSLKASDYLIFTGLVLIIGFVVYRYFPEIDIDSPGNSRPGSAVVEAPANSIAVLPFADISQAGDQEYLGDGISDTVMHVLSQVSGLIVTARTSSFAFKGQSLNIADIAQALRVANILEGSVQKAGNEVRIIARLIEAHNGTELWSGYFDRELESIFDIQDEIAREVVAALKVTVLDKDQGRLEERYRPDLKAYEQLILGRAELGKGTAEARALAGVHFEKAIELDPDYAEPYIDLSWIHLAGPGNSSVSMQESAKLRRPLIEKALDLDPTSAAAHTALGFLLRDEGQIDASTESFQRAIELNQSFAAAYAGYGSNLFRAGRFEESLAQHKKAVELNPQENQFQIFLANAYWTLAQSEKALSIIADNIKRNPALPTNYSMMVNWLTQMGQLGKAMLYQQAAHAMDPASPRAWLGLCNLYDQMLDNAARFSCINEYLEAFPGDTEARMFLARWNGDYDLAIQLGRQLVAASPHWAYRKQQLVMMLSYDDRWSEVVELIRTLHPELFVTGVEMNAWNIWMATILAQAFLETDNAGQGMAIAKSGLDFISRQRKIQGGAHIIGSEDAQFYAILGERSKMLEALEDTINKGWTFYAMDVLTGPNFSTYQDDPDFQAMVGLLRSNIEKQRQWYMDHAADPLY